MSGPGDSGPIFSYLKEAEGVKSSSTSGMTPACVSVEVLEANTVRGSSLGPGDGIGRISYFPADRMSPEHVFKGCYSVW
jgi:hypothetical protein